MVRFYINMIRNGRMTLDDVPEKWRDTVEKALAEK